MQLRRLRLHLIQRHLDGDTLHALATGVHLPDGAASAHLATCVWCERRFAALDPLAGLARSVPVPRSRPPAPLLALGRTLQPVGPSWTWWRPTGVATAAAAVVLVAALSAQPGRSPQPRQPSSPRAAAVATLRDAVRAAASRHDEAGLHLALTRLDALAGSVTPQNGAAPGTIAALREARDTVADVAGPEAEAVRNDLDVALEIAGASSPVPPPLASASPSTGAAAPIVPDATPAPAPDVSAPDSSWTTATEAPSPTPTPTLAAPAADPAPSPTP